MAKRCTALVLLLGLSALLGGGHAQDAPTAKNKRTFYVVKHGDAKELANVLGKHFKGDAEVQVLPDSPGNCLLISAAPNVFEEVVKLLEQLDKRPQSVAVEVLVAEVAPRKDEDGKPARRDLNEKEFAGLSKDVQDKLEAMKKDGRLSNLKRIELTAVENQPAKVQVGESKPTVAAVTVTGTGRVARSIVYRNTGTQAEVTAKVGAENTVSLDLSIQDSRLHVADDAPVIGKDEDGTPVRVTEVVLSTLKTRLSIPSGQAVAAEGVKTDSKAGPTQILVVVSARVLEPGARGGK
jgi:type II secretory pathway component GspD/PulD (secretin)